MEASPAQIMDFFNGFKQSLIPLFQREYQWGQTKWDALWQDIMERYEAEKDLSHFMGAVVTMPAKSVPVGVSKFMVIDGQQRLTTIAILLCAIRDELPEEAKPQRKRIQNHYLTNDGYEDWEYLKILPTQLNGDRLVFRSLVLCEPTNTESNILAAHSYFRKRLNGKSSDGEAIDPIRLLETIERRLIVVNINLGDADDPYLIFESLNFKGEPLTQADLVRNYFLMRFTVNEQQRVYDQLWLPMQQRLDAYLTEFMRQYLMKDGEEVARSEIYPALKKRVADVQAAAVESQLRAMTAFSEYYLRLVQPEKEGHPAIRRCLTRLQRWDLATANPLLLRLYEAYQTKKLTAENIEECLRMVESFAVRRAICEVPTNQLKRIFLQLAKTFEETNTITWLQTQLASGSYGARWPKDDEVREAWLAYRAYNPARIDRCAMILESLEEHHGHKEPADFKGATIEHIMPQTLNDGWREMLGPRADDVHGLYLHTIGNLTLTAYNAELSNWEFPKKKKTLAESHFELNKCFAGVQTWGEDQILTRSKAMWDRARQIWPRPDVDLKPVQGLTPTRKVEGPIDFGG
jgi:hypothetical protein